MRYHLPAALVLAILASAAAEPPAGRNDARGDAARGKQLFTSNGCGYCHGTVGQGGGGRTGGLRLAQMGIAYPAFLSQVRNPRNEMPPYVEAVVPEKDVVDMYAYVASLTPPPDVKSIPILNN